MITFHQFLENQQNKKKIVGTCVNSFDEDANCINPDLPYNDTTEFAQAEENAKKITKKDFTKAVDIPPNLQNIKAIYLHDRDNNVYMLYDEEEDIHYFFT